MQTTDFDFELPEGLIAQHPVEPRDSSRLLIVDRRKEGFGHETFRDILNHLIPGDVLVLNNTRVIPARLFGVKEGTGAKLEVLLLTRTSADVWEVLVKPGKKAKVGTLLVFGDGSLRAEVTGVTEAGARIIRFRYSGVFEQILDRLGSMPLPPYITEELEDRERYQTVYAKEEGSSAAPTAGLHFTPELLEAVKQKQVEVIEILLHVGLGTFRPVKVGNIEEHPMHSEYFRISPAAAASINAAKREGRRVIAVGTTAVRTLESAAVSNKVLAPSEGWTNIFIYPGYQFKIIDALVTNFHFPKSTLLMLVSALADRERILQAYAEAVRLKYRFYSFGDAMFIL